MELLNNKAIIKKIIEELKKIEKDEDVIVNFFPNEIEEEYFTWNERYVLLKNTIEIKSKRLVKADDEFGFMD